MQGHHSQAEKSHAGSLIQRLIAGVVLINLFVFLLSGVFLYQSRIYLEKRYKIKTQNLAQVFEDSIAENVGRIDILLVAVKDKVEEQLASGGIHEKKLNLFIERYFLLVPQLASLRVVDADGEERYGIGVVKRVNVADRDYFIQLRDNGEKGLVFAKPVESRMSGEWVLNIARRLNREDGSFAGVVFGQIAIDTFTDSFAKVNLGKDGSIALRNAEYEIIARYPEIKSNTEVERKRISSQFRELLESGIEKATFKARYPLDNIERIYTFHRIGDYPIIINVGLAINEYLTIWRKEVAINLLLLLIFSLGSLVFTRALIVRWRSEKQVQAELRRSNETLEQRIQERTQQLSVANEQLTAELVERKRGEEARRKLEGKLQQAQKAESLGRMAGAIAHTFNNMLTAVLGNLDLAINALPENARPLVNLTAAMTAASRAAEVSGLMLTYLGQIPGKHEPLDLSAVCRRGLPMLTAAMPERVNLKIDLPATGPIIKANEHQLYQILTNLIANAWEAFGEGGGNIHLAVKTVFPADIPTRHFFPLEWESQDPLYACLEVTDDGCGITEKDIDALFDPFFTTKFTGRGLGLSVVLGLVRAHYGVVTVESEQGHGSCFRIFFPVVAEAVALPPEPAIPALEIEGGSTVLLVEDEPIVREIAQAMLVKLGFAVLEAKDGSEAVELFRQHQDTICCVLSDLTMPGMDGWETLAAVRRLQPGIPVILASGYKQDQVLAGDHPVWPQAFLSKPYTLIGLRDAISKALSVPQESGAA